MVRPFTISDLRRIRTRRSPQNSAELLFCPVLSAALAAADEKAYQLIISEALREGVKLRQITEIVLQSHLFLGYPAMIEGMRLLAECAGTSSTRNGNPRPYGTRQCRSWHAEGMKKIRKLYGPQFGRLVKYINSFSPQVLTWMVNDGYGRVLSRPGASFELRELSTVATLTVTGYTTQLGAHIRGTLNLGISPEVVSATITDCRPFCTAARIKQAHQILKWVVKT